MKDFANVSGLDPWVPPHTEVTCELLANPRIDILKDDPKMFRRLHQRFHYKVTSLEGGGLRHEMRGQEPKSRGENRSKVSRAECPNDAVWPVAWTIDREGFLLQCIIY